MLVGQKGEGRYPEGTQFLEAVIGGETVRVPMPPFYPPPTEPFLSRLKYAFFPNSHASATPTVAKEPRAPKPDIAWL